jgi:hypothetical protein
MKNTYEAGTEALNKAHVSSSASIGVAQNITKKYFVSTAMWATAISATGMRHPTYETIIWAWDAEKRERGKLLKHYYHDGRKQAIKFHFRFSQTLAWRELKQNMPNDNAYVEWD